MNSNIIYKNLDIDDLNLKLFKNFNRYQDVKKCWRKENGKWLLKDIAFVEEWTSQDYIELIANLEVLLKNKGSLIGAFIDDSLAGFVAIENRLFGSKQNYIKLSEIYVSSEVRNSGIGKNLFRLAIDRALSFGGEKLYISAHSSEESQAFYRSLGCVETLEYNDELLLLEPCDCHLEYKLK